MLHQSAQPLPAPITASALQRLPEVMQRYLRLVQVPGKTAIKTVHLKQRGSFRMKAEQPWLPMIAEQTYMIEPLSFAWHGIIKLIPLISVSAWDRFADGHGGLRVKLLSLFQLVDAHGPETDLGELQRYLSEIIWFPTAWLSEAIQWQAIDDHSVQATLQYSDLAASLILSFNDRDELIQMNGERYMLVDGKPVLAHWETHGGDYREVHGLRIPFQAEALWKLSSGDFSYFRGEITAIEYT